MKLDPESRRYLTVESLDPTTKTVKGEVCDIDGKPLGNSAFPLAVYTDLVSGKSFVRIAAVMPSNQDPQSQAIKDSLMALNPVHYDGNDGVTRGWYVPSPDYGYHEAAAA